MCVRDDPTCGRGNRGIRPINRRKFLRGVRARERGLRVVERPLRGIVLPSNAPWVCVTGLSSSKPRESCRRVLAATVDLRKLLSTRTCSYFFFNSAPLGPSRGWSPTEFV